MINGSQVLAVVPARGGSKGIPLKNLVTLGGRSLIEIVAKFIQQVEIFDAKVVSTDSDEIACAARDAGLDVPFSRPKDLAGDIVADVDVLIHALIETEKLMGLHYDIIVMLQPTSPFRKHHHLEDVLSSLMGGNYDSALTVSESDSKFHPLKQLTIVDGQIQYYDERGKNIIARQQLTPVFQRNGLVYAITRDCLLGQKSVIGKNCVAVVTTDKFVNIDTRNDLLYAEYLIQNNIAKLG